MRKALIVFFLCTASCGGTVAPDSPASDKSPPVTTTPTEWKVTSCAEVKAACTTAPAVYVNGHASGLADLEGARAEFAIRYVSEEGMGLDGPHGVVVGRTFVYDGAFETCVCVPHSAGMYPQVAAVVYAPGTTSETGHDVARATFSQRYATLGDEDLTYAFGAVPNDAMKEAAVAAMIDRSATVTLNGLSSVEGTRVVAGLVGDDRSIAPQLANADVTSGSAIVSWSMPGKASSSERIAFFVDKNGNGLCDVDADAGGFLAFGESVDASSTLFVGTALAPVCDALRTDMPRE
jgi:hypothetical protein